MKLVPRILVLALALSPLASLAQVMDLGPDITPFQRFRVHPHLDKAFEAMAKGDGRRAISELQAAHHLAPQNAAIARQLAAAYRRYGQPAQAEVVLREQLQRNPRDAGLKEELDDLLAQRKPSETAAPEPAPVPPPLPPVATPLPAEPPPPVISVAEPEPAPTPAPVPATEPRPAASPLMPPPPVAGANAGRQHTAPRAAQPPRRRAAPAATSVQAGPPGYAQASLAYAAVDRGDLSVALEHARRAAQQAPANMDYQRLLVYLLTENGHHAEAQAELTRLNQISVLPADTAWQELSRSVRQRLAWTRFDAAMQAQGRGDLAAALREAEAGLQQVPEVTAYRLQMLGLLLQDGQYERARHVVEEGLAQADDASLHMLRGAALQAQRRTAEATQAFDAALARPGLAPHEQQNYRVIAADAALAARQPERAQALIEPLHQGGDPGVLTRQAEIDTALRRAISPASLYTTALRMPVVNCFGSPYTAGCQIWPGANPADPASEIAQAAYLAYAQRHYPDAAGKAAQAAELNPSHLPYRLLRLQALVAAGQAEQAIAEADTYLQSHTDAAEVLALRSRVRHQLAQTEAASADARAALAAGGLSLSSEVDLLLQEGRRDEAANQFASAVATPGLRDSADPDLAYLATRVGDYRTGAEVFGRAHARGQLPVTSLQDAAYTATRVADNEQSVRYFREAIDAADDGRLQLTPRQKFATRRELSDRVRTWGVNALLGYRGISPGSVATQPSGFGDTVQAVVDAYWRPQGYRDGSFWEVYGGLAQTLYSRHGGPKGGDTTQGAIGLRAKPLREHNLVLAVERRFKIGSLSHNDWLLRAGYSGGFGTDMRVDVPHWNTLHVYAEAGRFLRRKQNYATFEAQAGRSFRLGDEQGRWVLFPHAVVGVDYDSLRTPAGYNGAAGAGVGVAARYWFREDKYHAPRSYLDLSLQYRARLAGDERGKGWFVRAALVY